MNPKDPSPSGSTSKRVSLRAKIITAFAVLIVIAIVATVALFSFKPSQPSLAESVSSLKVISSSAAGVEMLIVKSDAQTFNDSLKDFSSTLTPYMEASTLNNLEESRVKLTEALSGNDSNSVKEAKASVETALEEAGTVFAVSAESFRDSQTSASQQARDAVTTQVVSLREAITSKGDIVGGSSALRQKWDELSADQAVQLAAQDAAAAQAEAENSSSNGEESTPDNSSSSSNNGGGDTSNGSSSDDGSTHDNSTGSAPAPSEPSAPAAPSNYTASVSNNGNYTPGCHGFSDGSSSASGMNMVWPGRSYPYDYSTWSDGYNVGVNWIAC